MLSPEWSVRGNAWNEEERLLIGDHRVTWHINAKQDECAASDDRSGILTGYSSPTQVHNGDLVLLLKITIENNTALVHTVSL